MMNRTEALVQQFAKDMAELGEHVASYVYPTEGVLEMLNEEDRDDVRESVEDLLLSFYIHDIEGDETLLLELISIAERYLDGGNEWTDDLEAEVKGVMSALVSNNTSKEMGEEHIRQAHSEIIGAMYEPHFKKILGTILEDLYAEGFADGRLHSSRGEW